MSGRFRNSLHGMAGAQDDQTSVFRGSLVQARLVGGRVEAERPRRQPL